MEDFLRKRKYLNHLKQISAIKNGHYKSSLTLTNSRLLRTNSNNNFKQNINDISNNNQFKFKSGRSNTMLATSRTKNTQKIMSNYYIQKENLRLVQRIGTINSGINMKKYQRQYNQHKKIMRIHTKVKKSSQFFNFKIFDIKFQQTSVDPQQLFSIYQISNQKKNFLIKGNIYQLRKQQLRAKINQINLIKIQGKSWGIVEVKMNNFLPIKKQKLQIGNLVIEIV